MDDPTRSFLTAYNEIDKYLRDMTQAPTHVAFTQLVRDAARRSPAVRNFADDLKEYAQLRNAIVHDFLDEPIATPNASVVRRIVSIRDALVSPARVDSLASRPVVSCKAEEPIGTVVAAMREADYSKMPVYGGGQFVGLLTSNTVARWLGARFAQPAGELARETVGEVLRHQAKKENCEFLPRSATVFDALAAFDRFWRRGMRLDAILITQHGKPHESLLGIVTVYDLPRLHDAIAPGNHA